MSQTPCTQIDDLRVGDVMLVQYRFPSAGAKPEAGTHPSKVRPCIVLGINATRTSVIVAPISRSLDRRFPEDCLEIPDDERLKAGLRTDTRSWIKLLECNRVDLPNTAVRFRQLADGTRTARHGTLSGATVSRTVIAYAARWRQGLLNVVRVPADMPPQARPEIASQQPPATPDAATRQEARPEGDRDARLIRVRARAAALVSRPQACAVLVDAADPNRAPVPRSTPRAFPPPPAGRPRPSASTSNRASPWLR